MRTERSLDDSMIWCRSTTWRVSAENSLVRLALLVLVILGTSPALVAQTTNPPDRDDLLKGLGMGLATIADMNNYPGPKHVMGMKDDLMLTRDQLKKIEALDKAVSSAAIEKGGEIVQAEDELAKLFEGATVSEKVVRAKLEEIGKMRADLRFIHLQAHLRMKQILTADQIKKYSELRSREIKSEN